MQATAFVVGGEDGPGAALLDLARGLGFVQATRFSNSASADLHGQATPLLFFLFAEVPEVAALKPQADEIRFANSRRVRYAPMIYFCESPSREAIQGCIDMGFDDVVTMPFTPRRVIGRLKRMIDQPQVYFETAAYLGPDRRVANDPAGQHQHFRRLEIIRTAAHGVNIVRDQMHAGH